MNNASNIHATDAISTPPTASATPLLHIDHVTKRFPIRGGIWRRVTAHVHAVTDVSLDVARGETLGIVGESGCGKSTLAKLIVHLYGPDQGDICFDGASIAGLRGAALKQFRCESQMIFQDPMSSLNPRFTIGELIEEPLVIHHRGSRGARSERVAELLTHVGLQPDHAVRYPHEFSGGQRQRVSIARALALNPRLLVADEPVSALDVSVQGEILNVLRELQRTLGLTLVLISHDMKVIAQMCHRVAVMYLGRIVEILPAAELTRAKHPYTQALLASVLTPDPAQRHEWRTLGGDVPSPVHPPRGCAFHPRCPRAIATCCDAVPPLLALSDHHAIACPVVMQKMSQ